MTSLRLRVAGAGDAEGVARLHADSWRRHYRGAYADAFLDGDVVADRLAVWSARLADADARGGATGAVTILAEDGTGMVGFVHVVFDLDERWGSLVDNLHVASERRHGGIGTALLSRAAAATTAHATTGRLYLWVLAQNLAAQRFYRARGGQCVERAPVPAPGGVPGRLNGSPEGLRIAWPDAASLLAG
jgi:ribosomal protein S18 acetylase RimI-like enzyme